MLRSVAIWVVSPVHIDGRHQMIDVQSREPPESGRKIGRTAPIPIFAHILEISPCCRRPLSVATPCSARTSLRIIQFRPLLRPHLLAWWTGRLVLSDGMQHCKVGVVRSRDGNSKMPQTRGGHGVHVHPMAVVNEEIRIGGRFVSNLCQTNGVKSTRIEASSRR